MSPTDKTKVAQLAIPQAMKARASGRFLRTGGWVLVLLIGLLVTLFLSQKQRAAQLFGATEPTREPVAPLTVTSNPPPKTVTDKKGEVVLTASGYIIVRERVELAPKLAGTITWVGVRKGDHVKKGQLIARLEDAEYRARFMEAQGKLALAKAELKNAEVTQKRQEELTRTKVGTPQALDDANRSVDVANAQVLIAQGQLALAETWLNWCRIEAPMDGVVMEKYVDQDELVIPQGFGGTDHPSTLLVALADINDLEIEVDLNEMDTPKVYLNQPCRVRPEAYKDKVYEGYVSEISPEADRKKGTLEVKVKINKPDKYLVPELNARVDFLK